jgi:DNA-binding MarR family transcriptional regulator
LYRTNIGVSPTARPSDAQAERLLQAIRAIVRRFSVSERADVQICGVSVAQAATLEVLLAEGPMRASLLGKRLGIAPSTLTRNLDRLEERGLVGRGSDGEDGRAWRIVLTAKGRRAAERLEEGEHEFARSILDRLSPRARVAIVDHIEDLLVAVRDATESCCPGAFDHLMKNFPQACACDVTGEGSRP